MVLIVPYRDRAEHLAEFVGALGDLHRIVVVEQCDDRPFNRAKLINIGYLETLPLEFAAHDVDLIPAIPAGYPTASPDAVIQVVYSTIQTQGYLGGVTVYSSKVFEDAGGYHNDYFHRAEDNEMMFNLRRLGIQVIYSLRPFRELPHARSGPEFIPWLWQKAQLPRGIDMLKTCQYSLISKEQLTGYLLIKARL